MKLLLYQQEDSFVAGSFGGVFFSIWWQLPTAAQIWAVHELQKLFRKAHPGDFALLSVVKMGKIRSLPAEARSAATDSRKLLGPCIAEANVIELGSGIGVSIAQMLFTTMNLITRPKYPQRLLTSLSEGVNWLGPFVGVEPDSLLRAVQEATAARPVAS